MGGIKFKSWRRINIRKGLSPIIASVILSGVVLVIGGAVWSYSIGASTSIANDYVNDTLELVDEINERFVVEFVTNNTSGSELTVWVYNYGEVEVVLDTYLTINGVSNGTYLGKIIGSYESKKIPVPISGRSLIQGDQIAIKVHSRRQNNAYYSYIV